jgi:hypothetical protein
MKNYTKEATAAKAGLLRFCERICKGLGRTTEKLVTNILYGIAAGNSCLLTEIARALDEKILLKKTVDRLSRGLMQFSGHRILHENYLRDVEKHIDASTVFPIDGSDIAKPYSVAMEALHKVHDGSTGEIVPGYMTLEIAALTHKTKTPLPVYERVFSAAEKDFVSEDEEVLKGLRFLSKRFGHGGIRVKKNRLAHYKGKSVNIEALARRFKGKCTLRCMLHGETVCCKVTEIPIQLPAFGQYPFYLNVVYGFGKEPMLLLTNCHSNEQRFCTAIAKMYLLRWRIEDQFRFKKQQYDFEDFRVRSLQRHSHTAPACYAANRLSGPAFPATRCSDGLPLATSRSVSTEIEKAKTQDDASL